MIGCFMLLPVTALFLAGTAVTTALTMAMGVFISSLIAFSTTVMTFMIIIFS